MAWTIPCWADFMLSRCKGIAPFRKKMERFGHGDNRQKCPFVNVLGLRMQASG